MSILRPSIFFFIGILIVVFFEKNLEKLFKKNWEKKGKNFSEKFFQKNVSTRKRKKIMRKILERESFKKN